VGSSMGRVTDLVTGVEHVGKGRHRIGGIICMSNYLDWVDQESGAQPRTGLLLDGLQQALGWASKTGNGHTTLQSASFRQRQQETTIERSADHKYGAGQNKPDNQPATRKKVR